MPSQWKWRALKILYNKYQEQLITIMLLNIFIVTYNRADYLSETLKSLSQSNIQGF